MKLLLQGWGWYARIWPFVVPRPHRVAYTSVVQDAMLGLNR